jgi:hypothetical protein
MKLVTIHCLRCLRFYRVSDKDATLDWCPYCFNKHWSDA